MPSPHPKTPRGVQDIRTISGKMDRTAIRSRAYLRVACLEMERERRERERESALTRVQNVDARYLEIDAEKSMLLEALGIQAGAETADAASAPGRPASRRAQGGFTIRY